MPRRWLFTDGTRLPDPVPAIARLASGDGVVLRHYDAAGRTALAREIAALCRRRGLVMLVAADPGLARIVGAGLHLPERGAAHRHRPAAGLVAAAVHGRAGLVRARRSGAVIAFLSPVFPTPSHPAATGLGSVRFAGLARAARESGLLVYALGGVDQAALRRLAGARPAGYGAISAFTTQNRRP